jgi:hypothetical protein
MAFTFPTDTNNKAGAVKGKNNGTKFVLPVQDEAYDAWEVKRTTLALNTNTALTLSGPYEYGDFRNFGPGDVYIKLEAPATVDGADCVLVAEGTAQPIPIQFTTVNVISSGAAKVQVVGVKNNAA